MTPEQAPGPIPEPDGRRRGSSIVGIAIVSWNVRELLLRCLASLGLERSGGADSSIAVDPAAVIVVDNASADGSADAVRAAFPEVTVLANAVNRGFTAGNNQAFRALGIDVGAKGSGGDYPDGSRRDGVRATTAGGDLGGEFQRAGGRASGAGGDRPTPAFVLILNPDTELVGDALGVLIRHLAAEPGAGAVGPRLRYPDGRVQSSRRRFPTLGTALFESTPAEWWWPGNPWARRYRMNDVRDDVAGEVDWVSGAAILFRSSALAEVGGFDESFFMYAEELDLCRRLGHAGWSTHFEPAAEVIHHEGRSSDQVAPARHRHFTASRVRYVAKHFGRPAAWLVRAGLAIEHALAIGIEASKWLVGHRRDLRAARVRAYGAVIGDLVTGRAVQPPGAPHTAGPSGDLGGRGERDERGGRGDVGSRRDDGGVDR